MGIYNSNFDFNKYRAFYAVADTGSFSKAAETLHISQPAISYSVKELEDELGVKLFSRNGKRIKLTEKGQKLFVYVEKAFNKIMLAERVISESDGELTGTIRIGIYSHISLFALPKLIKEFIKLNPKVSFNIYTASTPETKEKLKNNELDLAILQYPVFEDETNFSEEILFELENCFFASKKFYDSYMEKHNSIIEYPLMLPMRGYDDISALEEMFRRKNMMINTNLRVYAVELSKKFALEGIGIGWGLKKSVEEEIKNKTLYEIPIDFKIPTTKFSISYNEKNLNDSTLEFLKYLKNNISEVISNEYTNIK